MRKKKRITLEQLDRLNAIYDEAGAPDEGRLIIFPEKYGEGIIVDLQYYNEDNLQ